MMRWLMSQIRVAGFGSSLRWRDGAGRARRSFIFGHVHRTSMGLWRSKPSHRFKYGSVFGGSIRPASALLPKVASRRLRRGVVLGGEKAHAEAHILCQHRG